MYLGLTLNLFSILLPQQRLLELQVCTAMPGFTL